MLRRKIPLNYRNVTGVASSRGAGSPSDISAPFESTLEHDFIVQLRFDRHNVVGYQTQTPVIHYINEEGLKRRYTPDVFVTYANGLKVMYEVKPRALLKKHWQDLRYRYKQAIRYGKQQGYRFKIVTDQEIRTIYGNNVRFLQQYQSQDQYDQRCQALLNALNDLESSTPQILIRAVGKSTQAQAELLHTLWRLVADDLIGVDLNEPLRMDSPIWNRTEVKWHG